MCSAGEEGAGPDVWSGHPPAGGGGGCLPGERGSSDPRRKPTRSSPSLSPTT